jgi:hypothetical protein
MLQVIWGRPGVSIAAFRAIFEESIIHGADFDRSIDIENEYVFFCRSD